MRSTGKAGEEYAAKQCEKAGYQIIERNFYSRFGEIDLIISDENYIVFVEVKSRAVGSMSHPAEAVTKAKQERIIKTAQVYLASRSSELQPRFDVISVFMSGEETAITMEWIQSAFY